MSIEPTILTNFTKGSWSGPIRFSQPGSNVTLNARFTSTGIRAPLLGDSLPFDVTPLEFCLSVLAPAEVQEGAGLLTGIAKVQLGAPALIDVEVRLRSSNPDRLIVPETVLVPKNSAEIVFDLNVPENTLVQGAELISISAEAQGYALGSATVVALDNEVLRLAMDGPSEIRENGSYAFRISADYAPGMPITIPMRLDRPELFQRFAQPILAAGATVTSLVLVPVDNLAYGPDSPITLSVDWGSASPEPLHFVLKDNEQRTIALSIPSFMEGQIPSQGKIFLGGQVQTNTVFNLSSSIPDALEVPTQVTVLAGNSSANFEVRYPDNDMQQGLRLAKVTASADGFPSTSTLVPVDDDDPYRILIELPLGPWTPNTSQTIYFVAENISGRALVTDLTTATFDLSGPNGEIPFRIDREPHFDLDQNRFAADLSVLNTAASANLKIEVGTLRGEVAIPPVWASIPTNITDAVFDAVHDRIIACLGTNEIVAIDSGTGEFHKFDPPLLKGTLVVLGANPNSLYAAIEGGQTIAQADLNTLQITKTWALGSGEGELLVADSLAPIPGQENSFVVVRSKASGLPMLDGLPSTFDLAVFKSDSTPITIPASGLSKTSLGVSEDGRHIYVARATSSENYTLAENALTPDAPLSGITADRYLISGDTPFGDGIFFTPHGVTYDPLVPGFYGNLPADFSPDSVAFNKTTGRFAWLVTGPAGSAQFRIYDSLTLNLLQAKVLPNVANGFNLLRPGGDRGWLAVLTDPAVNSLTGGTPRFIPDTVPTPSTRADLAITGSVEPHPDSPRVLRVHLQITNTGPDPADATVGLIIPQDALLLPTNANLPFESSSLLHGLQLGSLVSNESRDLTIDITAPTSRTISIAARVGSSAEDANRLNNYLALTGTIDLSQPPAPHLSLLYNVADAHFLLKFPTLPGWNYVLQQSPTPSGLWRDTDYKILGVASEATIDIPAPFEDFTFYRLTIQP